MTNAFICCPNLCYVKNFPKKIVLWFKLGHFNDDKWFLSLVRPTIFVKTDRSPALATLYIFIETECKLEAEGCCRCVIACRKFILRRRWSSLLGIFGSLVTRLYRKNIALRRRFPLATFSNSGVADIGA
jgi:hypothetical protein